MYSKIAVLLLTGMLIGVPAQCQLVEQYNPPQSNCCLAMTAKGLADQLLDWNQIGRYQVENQELKKQPPEPKRVLFMGDSITLSLRGNETTDAILGRVENEEISTVSR